MGTVPFLVAHELVEKWYISKFFLPNASNQKLWQSYLRHNDTQVVLARNGKEGVDLFLACRPHIVLMDVEMPVMDGLAATRHLRAIEAQRGLPRCPIIAVTAGALPGDRQKCLAADMDDYLAKPVEKEKLREVLNRFAPAEKNNTPT